MAACSDPFHTLAALVPPSTRSSIGFALAAVAVVAVLLLARPGRLAAEKWQVGDECGGGEQ